MKAVAMGWIFRKTDRAPTASAVALVVVLLAAPLRAGLDPNHSQPYPDDGYGIIICGNSIVFGSDLDDIIKSLLRNAYLILTVVYHFDPNNVWVLVDNGEDDWTEGHFDALPADEATVADAFQTIGERMWNDANTPRNLVVVIAGHGSRYGSDPPAKTLLQLADGLIYDDAFVADCFNQINDNAQGGSPIERLDLLMTPCYGGGLVDDFRDNFHALRGSTWPDARHVSILTAGDCYDVTSGFFGIQMVNAIGGDPNNVPDLNGDGRFSIYEYFDCAARGDLTNPTDPNYTPWVPETIYVPADYFWDLGVTEHPLYYEWHAPVTLTLSVVKPQYGQVALAPEPNDPNLPQYPAGSTVMLTATPNEGKRFKRWKVYDPNHPDDANHVALDTNDVLTIVMATDRQVTAVFACGGGAGSLPLLAVGAILSGLASRRVKRSA